MAASQEGSSSQSRDTVSISTLMATDSATLDRRAATHRRIDDTPIIQNPADPIVRGMGLNQPFFDDKNRAFWILQSIGWSGYFFLRSLSGFANSMGWMFLVHTVLLTMAGYSLTLLMASLFRRLIRMRPLVTLIFSLLRSEERRVGKGGRCRWWAGD